MTNHTNPMKRCGLLAVLAGMAGTTVASADVLQVPGDFPTIQIAINLAVADDEIVVGPGTYFEDLDFLGKRLTLRSSDGAAVTTIDAIGRFEPVITIQGASADGSVIEGFTLTNGQATDSAPGERGGGMYIDNANVSVAGCVFTGNLATIGGGMYANGSVLTISGSLIEANNADRGGGVYFNNCTTTIEETVFSMNASTVHGGGLVAVTGSYTMNLCEFLSNTTIGAGAGIEALGTSQVTVNRSYFHGNAAGDPDNEGRGGGFYCGSTANGTINNSLFVENSATAFGGAMYAGRPILARNCTFVGNSTDTAADGLSGANLARLRNCIAWDNGPSPMPNGNIATHSIIEGGFAGLGNTGSDSADEPIFVNRPGSDFRLAAGSPGIDAADSTGLPSDIQIDFNGEPRVVNALDTGASGVPVFGYYIDMGAFEFQPASTGPTCFGDANGDGQIDLADLNAVLAAFGSVCP